MSRSENRWGGDSCTIHNGDDRLDWPVSGELEWTAGVDEVPNPAPRDARGESIDASDAPTPDQQDTFTVVVASPHTDDLAVEAVVAQPGVEADAGLLACEHSFVRMEVTDSIVAKALADESAISGPATTMVELSDHSAGTDPAHERASVRVPGISLVAVQPFTSKVSNTLAVTPEPSMHWATDLIEVLTITGSADVSGGAKVQNEPRRDPSCLQFGKNG